MSAMAVSLGLACMSAHGAIIQQNNSEALVATETASGTSTQASATIGPIASYNGGENQNVSGAPVSQPSLFNLVPYSSSLDATFASSTDAQNAVSAYLSNYLSSISKAMATQMKSSGAGVSMGIFTFVQDVKIANPSGGTPTKSEVFGTLVVYPDGHYEYLGTNVNNNTIYMLYAIYQQKQNAYYLPANWVLPDAGDTQWELLKASFNGSTMSASAVSVGGSIWHLVNDNGDYDAPVTMNGDKQRTDYSAGVENWVKDQIVPLMKQNNASIGIIRYGQQVSVQRNLSGQPLVAMSVNSRMYMGGCGQKTLTNSGQYGYLLKESSIVYTVEPDGEYTPLRQVTVKGLALTSDGLIHENGASPIDANFSETAKLPVNASWSQEQNNIVFPIAPDQGQIVDWQSGNPLPSSDYVYVAPLQQQNGGQWVLPVSISYGNGGNYLSEMIMDFNGVKFASRATPFGYPDMGPPNTHYHNFQYTPVWTSANIPVVVNGNSAYIPVSISYGNGGNYLSEMIMDFNGVKFASRATPFGYPDMGPPNTHYHNFQYTPVWTSANIPLVCEQ
ncbi:hypothetical protein B1757_13625 [Acidithiobacillus marinus]|uniref:Uncharacterized protein n=1 Tax=Acidithiobacillus marinus TaxID=187490 RepID=A0A2I1DIE3_9PROT|nr:hypothetical protein B1757_13625 [Acidithiobacillus marinus]